MHKVLIIALVAACLVNVVCLLGHARQRGRRRARTELREAAISANGAVRRLLALSRRSSSFSCIKTTNSSCDNFCGAW